MKSFSNTINARKNSVLIFLLSFSIILALLTPAVFSSNLAYGVNTTKFFWIFFTSLALIPTILYYLLKKEIGFTLTDLLVISFLIYMIIQAYILDINILENDKLIYFNCSALVYFAIKQLLSIKHLHGQCIIVGLVSSIFFCVLFTCAFGILQKLNILPIFNNSKFSLTSTFFHPAPFAGFIGTIFPLSFLCWWYLYKNQSKSGYFRMFKWLSFITFCSIIFILPSTASRAAFLGVLSGILFILIKSNYLNFYINKLSLGRSSLAKYVIIVGFFILCVTSISILYRIREASVNGRFLAWNISLQMLNEKPMFGHGTDTFKFKYPQYQINFFKSGKATTEQKLLSYEVKRAFNEPLQTICELGIVGFIFLSLIVFSALRGSENFRIEDSNTLSIQNIVKVGAKGSLVSFVVFSMFSYPFSLPELTLYFFVSLALADESVPAKLMLKKNMEYVFKACLVLVLLVVVLRTNACYKSLLAHYEWNKGLKMSFEKNFFEANTIYKNIYPELKNDDLFLSNFGYNLSKLGLYELSNNILNTKQGKTYDDLILLGNNYFVCKKFGLSERLYLEAYYLLPHKFYPLYHLMRIYSLEKNNNKAKAIAREILNKKVKIDSYEISFIRREAKQLLNTSVKN